MAGFMDYAEMDVPELELAPDGEYKIEIRNVTVREESEDPDSPGAYSSGREGWDIIIAIDHPNCKSMIHRVFKPKDDDEDRVKDNMVRGIKRFGDAFEITDSDTDTWVGKEAYALIGTESNSEYGDKNVIVRFIKA